MNNEKKKFTSDILIKNTHNLGSKLLSSMMITILKFQSFKQYDVRTNYLLAKQFISRKRRNYSTKFDLVFLIIERVK